MKTQTVWQCVFLYQMTFCGWKQRISCFRGKPIPSGEFSSSFQLKSVGGSLSSPSCNKNPGTLRQSKQETSSHTTATASVAKFPCAHQLMGFLHGFQQQTFKKTHLTRQFPPFLCVYPQTFRCVFFFVLSLEVKMMNSSLEAGLAKADDVLARGQQAVDGGTLRFIGGDGCFPWLENFFHI